MGCRKWGCNKWGLKGCLGHPSWKSAEIGLFHPFSALFALFRRARTAPGKPRKRRKKAFFLRYPRTCLNPHLLNPHLRHSRLWPLYFFGDFGSRGSRGQSQGTCSRMHSNKTLRSPGFRIPSTKGKTATNSEKYNNQPTILTNTENSRRLWLSEIPCWKSFSGKFRRCWKILHRFSGSAKCYPCQGLGIFRQGKRLLENWPRLRERCWIFSSETATAFLSSSDKYMHIDMRSPALSPISYPPQCPFLLCFFSQTSITSHRLPARMRP